MSMKNLQIAFWIFIGFVIGYTLNHVFNPEINSLRSSNEFKYELIKLQDEALMKVDTIFWNNNIYDGDGGDTMCDYLELRNKIDNLYNTQL